MRLGRARVGDRAHGRGGEEQTRRHGDAGTQINTQSLRTGWFVKQSWQEETATVADFAP